ncbi:hypothetical protein LXL04_016996 [Taraxacum kok-saghyz]
MAEAVATGAGVAATVIQAKAILLQPLKQTIASSNDMDEIYGELGRVMETLIARRNDHDEDRLSDVVAKEVDELKVRYTKENKRSPWFSINARSNFTKKMKKTAFWVVTLIEENNHLVDVLVDKKPACVIDMLTSQITNIPTLQQSLEETLDLLCNKEVSDIKIYGLVGSGKRIIMKNLNNHIKVAEMFDIVIWVSVSRKGNMKHRDINQIQQDIIERLELNIGITSNVDLIANRIRAELTNIKYLLLLDDVNEDLDLDKIGVSKRENGSKIVITARLQRVCSSIATTQINVEILKPKEAVELFKSELNRPLLEENPNIKN